LANLAKSYLARSQVRSKELDVNLHELFGYFENNKLKYCEGQMARNIGDIMIHMDDDHMVDAEIWIKKAIEADTRNGTRWYLATDHALYADWFRNKGDLLGAVTDRQHGAIRRSGLWRHLKIGVLEPVHDRGYGAIS